MLRPLAVVTSLLAMVDKCPVGKSCTEIGCADGASLSLRVPGAWPAGSYVFGFELGGQSFSCTAQLPEDFPDHGSTRQLPCGAGPAGPLSATFVQDAECMDQRSRDAVSEACRPLADRFTLQVGVQGTPEVLEVRIARDGLAVLAQEIALEYQTSRPNGPDCEPLCRQSHAELTLP